MKGLVREMIKYLKRIVKRRLRKNNGQEIRTDIKMGKNVQLINSFLDYCFGHLITIGDNVVITNAAILAHDGSTQLSLGYSKIGRVDIGSNVFIGYGSIVLPNTRIGNNVIVGAGTIVTKDIPDNTVVCGNPMRILCSYDAYVQKQKQKMNDTHVFNVIFNEKTDEERKKQYEILGDFKGGFDL